MPVPTPPKKNLLKVTPPEIMPKKLPKTDPKKIYAKQKAANKGPSRDTQKLSSDIRQVTEELKDEKNTVEILSEGERITQAIENLVSPALRMSVTSNKRPAFTPPEHLTTSPFKDDPQMQELAKNIKEK